MSQTTLACLLNMLLVGCDAGFDQYRPTVAVLPSARLALIREVDLWDRDYARTDGREGWVYLLTARGTRAINVHASTTIDPLRFGQKLPAGDCQGAV